MSFFEQFVAKKNKSVEKEVKFESFNEPFVLRRLMANEYNKIAAKAADVQGRERGKGSATINSAIELVLKSLVYPDFNKTEVMEAAEMRYKDITGEEIKVTSSEQALLAMLYPNEFEELTKVAMELSNVNTQQRKEEEEKDFEFR